MKSFFITGTGTNVGKTIVSAILVEALQANYWKPVQAGLSEGTDTSLVQSLITNNKSFFFPEVYKLKLATSPHFAAREERINIIVDEIYNQFVEMENHAAAEEVTIVEGAGGLMVPLNENDFVIDLIKKLNIKVVLVCRNYLGSINHSMLTAALCRQKNIDVAGWIFNGDDYLGYESEIAKWSGLPIIASIPFSVNPDKDFISEQATLLKEKLYYTL